MYVYIESERDLWTVGFYQPDGKWEPDSDHPNRAAAAQRVSWLNGGIPEETKKEEKEEKQPNPLTVKQVIEKLGQMQNHNSVVVLCEPSHDGVLKILGPLIGIVDKTLTDNALMVLDNALSHPIDRLFEWLNKRGG